MTVVNNLKKQVDLPIWEWLRFAPVVTAAGLCVCADETAGGRYIYYLAGTTFFYRYDTVCDSWQQLQGPNIAPLTASSMRYTTYDGYRGRILSATSTSVTIPGLHGSCFVGKTIRITEGTGVGQDRVISAVTEPEIVESGMAVTASATAITDNQTIPKKWTINQWRGYQCRVVYGTGASQVRKILYNDTNTLTFSASEWQPFEHWNNTGFSIIAPYAAPITWTASVFSHYFIEKQTVTVPQWTTTPDATSKFMILTGGIWMATGRSLVNGAIAMQFYDVASDTWASKTTAGGLAGALLTGDVAIERCGERGGIFESGDCDSSGYRTMIDTTKTWTTDQWTSFSVIITNTATGTKQRSTILGNTVNTLYIDDTSWDDNPSAGVHTYIIQGNANNIWVAGNNQASIYKYLIEQDAWTDGWHYSSGICCNLSLKYGKQYPFSYTATVFATYGMLSVHATPTAPGSGYKIGDILSVTGWTNGKVRVTGIDATGGVTSLELYACGTAGTGTVGTGKATASVIPAAGGGTLCTVNVLTVGSVARFTTPFAHNLRVGDIVTTNGAAVPAWNSTFTVLACDSTTAFDVIPPNDTPPVASNSNAATLVVDASKNWTINEHKGKLVSVTTFGIVPTSAIMKITSNTATTLVVPTMSIPVTGTSRYLIKDQKVFGSDWQEKIPARDSVGWAIDSGSSSTVLATSDKAWIPNQWVGYKLRVICGTGYDQGEIAITANTATTLTSAAWGFTPDSTTKYEIEDTFGVANSTFGSTSTLIDTTKNWVVNQWSGKPIRFNAGINQTAESIILSNTSTIITCGTITLPTATTCYSILGVPQRQVGIQVMWNYGQIGTNKGKFLYVPRGGTTAALGNTVIDRYNLTTHRWDYCLFVSPQTELHALATQWSYDNEHTLYFCPAMATCSRIFAIDLDTQIVSGAGQTPYAHGAGVQGNKMEIITTEDGLKYLYILRQTGSEFWRTLIYWNG
jgi:hypothetical protein